MARPRTPISSHGAIAVEGVKFLLGENDRGERRRRVIVVDPKLETPDVWRARTRYRFDDGKLRQVERFAPTKAKAKTALQLALTTMTASTGVEVKRETNLADLADRFMLAKADKAPRTVDTYRQTIEHHLRPKLGNLSVSEATTERLGRFLATVATEHGPGAAKACRAVLSGMMAIAARSDAIRVNPVREIAPIAGKAQGAVAIDLEQLPILLAAVRADERLQSLDMVDLIEFLAGTGCRIGEACGLSWDDVDLTKGTARIAANVIRGRGIGVVRQDHPKTRAGVREISLPASLIGVLGDRRIRGGPNPHGLVFPTVLGNVRDPRGTSRDWAEARVRIGFPDITTHSFRKTVATALDQAGLSARDIAEYLGHENPSLTQDVYMAKNTGGRKAAIAIDELIAHD